jgi:hypothetical protein
MNAPHKERSMPTPMEICLEDLDLDPEDERYMRCVALPGGEPGLALDCEGAVRWMPDGAAYGIWVSLDQQIVLLRAAGTGPITVTRGGRSLEAPASKPVVLLHGDWLQVNGRRLQVHIHGVTEHVHEPERLGRSALARMARVAATALALGAAVGAGDASARAAGQAPIEVRDRPPGAPAMYPVLCSITSMTPNKKGPLVVRARCSGFHQVPVGARGQLLDSKSGKDVKNGTVVVKKAKGDQITAEGRPRGPVKADQVRFYVR